MYELSRVRLFSVGPKGARYNDVVLDLRDAGKPVTRPSQEALFETDVSGDVQHLRRRPSPASVLFLENGGGKSVLIKLIFSVMLPGRRQVVGASSTRVFDNFVLAQDVSHVALEWQHVVTGQRVVVGKVCAWRDHVVSANPARLLEAWYSFRPTVAFNLDTLPCAENGRIVSMAGFRDRLTEAGKVEPHLETMWEDRHKEWTKRLANLGLDPELFNYQRKMNASEGEAADAFTFKSDEAFVGWLLTAVTNEEDLDSLGDVVEAYAAKLSTREELMAERDFVEGALQRLSPLAKAAADLDAARELQREARATAEAFATAIAVRLDHEKANLARIGHEAEEVAQQEKDANTRAMRLSRIHIEMQRSLAALRWDAAEQRQRELEATRDDAKMILTAWQASARVLAYRKAYTHAERVRHQVEETEEQAAPLLVRRNEAAARLVRALLALAADAEAEADHLDAQTEELEQQAGQAEKDANDAAVQAERERGRARQAEEQIQAVSARLKGAVEQGLLADEDEDVSAAAEYARQQAADAGQQITATLEHMSVLAERRNTLTTEWRGADQEYSTRKNEAQTAERALATAEAAAMTLCASERLAGLLGAEQIMLDTDAPTLLGLLRDAIAAAEQEMTELRIGIQADQRVLDALGSGGLLPPSADVTAALKELESAGITAWSGWRYLANIPAEHRNEVLTAYPHLVDGIVLNNPVHLSRAEQLLLDARLLPRTVVAVGTTQTLTARGAPPPAGIGFLVPPNPAMYDERAAEWERTQLITAQEQRRGRLSELGERTHADSVLVSALDSWRRDYPPGTLDRLREDNARAQQDSAEAEQQTRALRDQLDGIEQTEKDIQESLPSLRAVEGEVKERAGQLADLAAASAQIPGWQSTAHDARGAADAHDADAHEHSQRAKRLRKDIVRLQVTAGEHRRVSVANRNEIRTIPGAGEVDQTLPAPEEPMESLRDAYRDADIAYQQADVGIDLRQELDRAEQAEASASADLKQIPQDVVSIAERLLTSPDGADAPARAAATKRTEDLLHTCEEDVTAQANEVGRLKSEFNSIPRQEVTLEPPYEQPTSIEQAERLVESANSEREEARRRYDVLREAKEKLDAAVSATQAVVGRFDAHCEVLAEFMPDSLDEDAAPFTGDIDRAATRRTEILGQVREASETFQDAERTVRKAADALASYATDERFEQVASLVRRQIVTVVREDLPQYAQDWDKALRPRLRSLNDDLAQINRHRSAIIDRLRGMVKQALTTLRSACRLSRLPAGLGDWAGQEFLRIKFDEAESKLLEEALGTVIDQATGRAVGRGDKDGGKRDGLTLLLRGVRAAMPKGVAVDMLKPDTVLRTERVRVAEIGDVFSGGQLLTAAIILYCTMAALRANDRGDARRPHAGVLFLDNPIGRASAGYLLELQLAVAEALGVQLIYTTGLFDTNALSVFPLIIRLRNDADLRAGLKYLTVDQAVQRPLADLGEPDGTGQVASTRVYTRPAEPEENGQRPA